MKKVCFVMATVLTALLAQVEASVMVDLRRFGGSANQVATFSDLDATPVTSSNGIMVPSGSFSASMGPGETFVTTVSGISNWNYAAVSGAGHLSGLGNPVAYANIDGNNSGWGVDGAVANNAAFLDLTTEALVVNFDLSGLTAAHQSDYRLTGFDISEGADPGDIYNYMIIDASGGVKTSASGQTSLNLPLDIALDDGDSLVIGNEVGTFKVSGFAVDVIPEPATLGLVVMACTGLLGIRRRGPKKL